MRNPFGQPSSLSFLFHSNSRQDEPRLRPDPKNSALPHVRFWCCGRLLHRHV